MPASEVIHFTATVAELPTGTAVAMSTALQFAPGILTGTLAIVVPPGPTAVRMIASLFGKYGENVTATEPEILGVQFVLAVQVLAPVHVVAPPGPCEGSPKKLASPGSMAPFQPLLVDDVVMVHESVYCNANDTVAFVAHSTMEGAVKSVMIGAGMTMAIFAWPVSVHPSPLLAVDAMETTPDDPAAIVTVAVPCPDVIAPPDTSHE